MTTPMRPLSADEHEDMIARLYEWAEEDGLADFDFLQEALALEAEIAAGRILDPARYQPNDPAFWWAMAQECRRVAGARLH